MDVQVAYTGGDPGNYALFLDLEEGAVVQILDSCEDLAFQSYVGFVSEIEAVVVCQDYGSPTERYESINLLNGSVLPLSSRPRGLSSYGMVVRNFEVTKMQRFE